MREGRAYAMTTMDEELAKGGTRRDAAERVMARLWAGETVTMTCSCGALATMTPVKKGPAPYFVTHEGGDEACPQFLKHAHGGVAYSGES